MRAVLAKASGEGAVFVASNDKQALFEKGGTIIGCLSPSPALVEDVLYGDFGRHRQLITANPEGLRADRACAHAAYSDDPVLEGRARERLRRSKAKSLEGMLKELYAIVPGNQFAFIDEKDAKCLYAPSVQFSVPPETYQKRGELNARLERINAGFYEAISAELRVRACLKSGWLQDRLQQRALRKIVDRFLDYHDGPVERLGIIGYLERQQARKPRLKLSMQARLDKEFMPKGQRALVLSLANSRRLRETASTLEKELGLKVRPLVNLPYAAVSGDEKDIRRFYQLVKGQRWSFFSANAAKALQVKRAVYAHGFCIPELMWKRGNRPAAGKGELWNHKNIGSDRANQITLGEGARIAVCDTGVDYRHSELADRFTDEKGYDFIDDNPDPMDLHYHGTHVAGTVAGRTTGVAPGCTLYAVRVLNENGYGTLDAILRGLDWCISKNMDAVNFSLGSARDSGLEYEMFKKAYDNGIICVAAAGNEGWGPSYPASYDCVLAVAAVDRDNKHAEFSNIYYTNNISAPGVGIYSALPNNSHGLLSGTSMAAPHIAGVAGLVSSLKNYDMESCRRLLEETCLPLGNANDPEYWSVYGCGLVQADKAARRAR